MNPTICVKSAQALSVSILYDSYNNKNARHRHSAQAFAIAGALEGYRAQSRHEYVASCHGNESRTSTDGRFIPPSYYRDSCERLHREAQRHVPRNQDHVTCATWAHGSTRQHSQHLILNPDDGSKNCLVCGAARACSRRWLRPPSFLFPNPGFGVIGVSGRVALTLLGQSPLAVYSSYYYYSVLLKR